jgi:hypothetical protein
MKYTMQTQSGAVYHIDEKAMTWRRVGTVPIIGLSHDATEYEGKLAYLHFPVLGERCILYDSVVGPITTTRVVRLELTSDA